MDFQCYLDFQCYNFIVRTERKTQVWAYVSKSSWLKTGIHLCKCICFNAHIWHEIESSLTLNSDNLLEFSDFFIEFTPIKAFSFSINIRKTFSVVMNIHHSSFYILMGKGNPSQNLACFVRYLIIINIFWENKIRILKQIVWETQINGITILVGPAVLMLLIKLCKILFQSIT